MSDLYNTVLGTYTDGFDGLSFKARFHFASRLYLWEQQPQAKLWLEGLRPIFTADDNPRLSLEGLFDEPPPILRESAAARAPFLLLYPKLFTYERALFRLVFLYTIYGIDARPLITHFFTEAELKRQRDDLLDDRAALATLSTFAINYLYLLDRFILEDETSLPLERFLELGKSAYQVDLPLQRQLRAYFYTHCIIAESWFYARRIPDDRWPLYLEMLRETEGLIQRFFDSIKLDNMFEFLVCCCLLDYSSPLEPEILRKAERSLSSKGYIIDPLKPSSADLRSSEHRNVLFLMSQRPFKPLVTYAPG